MERREPRRQPHPHPHPLPSLPRKRPAWWDKLGLASRQLHRLNQREQSFIRNLLHYGDPPSPRQLIWLEDIASRFSSEPLLRATPAQRPASPTSDQFQLYRSGDHIVVSFDRSRLLLSATAAIELAVRLVDMAETVCSPLLEHDDPAAPPF